MPRISTHGWVFLCVSATLHRGPLYHVLSYCQVAVTPQLTSQLCSQALVLGCKMEPGTKGSSKEQLWAPTLTTNQNRMGQKREDSWVGWKPREDFAFSTGAISYPSLTAPEIDRTFISSGDACYCLLMMSQHGWAGVGAMEWCVDLTESSILFELDCWVGPGHSSHWMSHCQLPGPWQALQWFLTYLMRWTLNRSFLISEKVAFTFESSAPPSVKGNQSKIIARPPWKTQQ